MASPARPRASARRRPREQLDAHEEEEEEERQQAAEEAGPSRAGPSRSGRPSQPRQKSQQQARTVRGGVACTREELEVLEDKRQRYRQQALDAAQASDLGQLSRQVESLAGTVVRHMLYQQHQKPNHMVPRSALVELVTEGVKEHKNAKKLPGVVIAEAQARFLEVFGLEMKEVEREAGGKAKGTGAGGAKLYVLQSALPPGLRQRFVLSPTQGHQHLFKMLVLSLIHLEGGKIDEGRLWDCLEQLGFVRDVAHPKLGGKPQEELVHLEGLRVVHKSRKQQPGGGAASAAGGEVEHVYEWAEGASAEVSQAELKAFIDEMFTKGKARAAAAMYQGPADGGDDEEEVIDV